MNLQSWLHLWWFGRAKPSSFDERGTHLYTAKDVANAAMLKLADVPGILHDPCELDRGAERSRLKGVVANYSYKLNSVE